MYSAYRKRHVYLACPLKVKMLILQATIFGSWGICAYDLYGKEITETNKQEGAAYPNQQTKVDLCGPI